MKHESGDFCGYCGKPMTDAGSCDRNPFSDFHVAGTPPRAGAEVETVTFYRVSGTTICRVLNGRVQLLYDVPRGCTITPDDARAFADCLIRAADAASEGCQEPLPKT